MILAIGRSLARGFYLAFLTRYAIFLMALPALLAWLGTKSVRSLLYGLLVMENWLQSFNVTWVSMVIVTFGLVARQIIVINAPRRYESSLMWAETGTQRPWRFRWGVLVVLGLALPLTCLSCTVSDCLPETSNTGCFLMHLSAIVAGAVFAIALMYFATAIQAIFVAPSSRDSHLLPCESWPGIAKLKQRDFFVWGEARLEQLATVIAPYAPGYTDEVYSPDGSKRFIIAPGHVAAAVWMAVTILFYFGTYLLFQTSSRMPYDHDWIPAVFYLLVLGLLIGSFLPGFSFFIDRFRLPVVVVVLIFAWIGLRNTDHYFEIPRTHSQTQLLEPPSLLESVEQRYSNLRPTPSANAIFANPGPRIDPKADDVNNDGKRVGRTLVVVSASGGGIQAAAWTAKVLTGLDAIFGDRFTRSIVLISPVSGGSVGTLHYLMQGRWNSDHPTFSPKTRDDVNALANASSLEAAGWGLAFPDAMRVVMPFLVPANLDRGVAMETVWHREGCRRLGLDPEKYPLTLGDWARDMKQGQMPIVVFNSTIVETGQRLLISPVRLGLSNSDDDARPLELVGDVSSRGLNMRAATAARLSATFPYVTPIARPAAGSAAEDRCRHVADGGYVDNEGIFTVVPLINELLTKYDIKVLALKSRNATPPFSRVLVIRIHPFPPSRSEDVPNASGLEMISIGPLDAMLSVRNNSQIERNDTALDLVSDLWNHDASDDKKPEAVALKRAAVMNAWSARQAAPAALKATPAGTAPKIESNRKAQVAEFRSKYRSLKVVWTEFNYEGDERSPADTNGPPLSWKLTKLQQKSIRDAWTRLSKDGAAGAVGMFDEPPLKTIERYFKLDPAAVGGQQPTASSPR